MICLKAVRKPPLFILSLQCCRIIMSWPRPGTIKNANSEANDPEVETYIQFEDGAVTRWVIDSALLGFSIAQVKRRIIDNGMMGTGTMRPENISMHLIMPPMTAGEATNVLVMEDSKKMETYFNDLTRCQLIKMTIRDITKL